MSRVLCSSTRKVDNSYHKNNSRNKAVVWIEFCIANINKAEAIRGSRRSSGTPASCIHQFQQCIIFCSCSCLSYYCRYKNSNHLPSNERKTHKKRLNHKMNRMSPKIILVSTNKNHIITHWHLQWFALSQFNTQVDSFSENSTEEE